jgi:hypothetical protein
MQSGCRGRVFPRHRMYSIREILILVFPPVSERPHPFGPPGMCNRVICGWHWHANEPIVSEVQFEPKSTVNFGRVWNLSSFHAILWQRSSGPGTREGGYADRKRRL